MSQTLQLIQELVARGEIRISEHGYDELAADNISVEDILDGVAAADLVEDYPEYFRGTKRSRITEGPKWSADPRRVGNPERSSNAGRCCDCLSAGGRQVVG